MAEGALPLRFVFAVADDILALAVAAVKDLDHHDQRLPSPNQRQPGTNQYLLGLLEVGVLMIGIPYFSGYVSSLRRAFQRNEPAMILNKTGLVDYASGYMVGQLAWDEIQSMYPWTREHRLLPNRFFRTPIIAKHRFFCVVLKEKAYLKGFRG